MADAAALDFNRAFTIEAWVKVDAYTDTWTPIFYKGNANDPDARVYSAWLQSNGSLWFGVRDASGQQTIQTDGGLIPAGEWHHVARGDGPRRAAAARAGRWRRAAQRRLCAASTTWPRPMPLVIGANVEPGNNYANLRGSLDEIRLWNVARSEAEIAAAKDAAIDVASAGLVAYLKADEGSGSALVDATGQGHSATLQSRVTPVVPDASSRWASASSTTSS